MIAIVWECSDNTELSSNEGFEIVILNIIVYFLRDLLN